MRHAQRHIEASVALWIESHLTGLGWLAPVQTDRPYGAGPLEVSTTLTGMPGTDPGKTVLAGTNSPVVGVAILSQDAGQDQEVGGPAIAVEYDLMVTVLAAPSLATAVADDLLDLLDGRVARPVVPFMNMATSTVVGGETLEIEDVSMGRADASRGDWIFIQGVVVRSFARDWS